MKIEISLNEADRERIGCPDKVYVDFDELSINDLIDVQKATGLKAPEFAQGILTGDAIANKAIVWIGLRASGVDIEYDELTYKLAGSSISYADEETDDEGKGSSPSDTPSETTS